MVDLPSIQSLIDRGALFVINHSAGKDSQAMTIVLKRIIPADQLLVIGEVLKLLGICRRCILRGDSSSTGFSL